MFFHFLGGSPCFLLNTEIRTHMHTQRMFKISLSVSSRHPPVLATRAFSAFGCVGGRSAGSGEAFSTRALWVVDAARPSVASGPHDVRFLLQMADAMEMMILSILAPQLHCEWRLPSWQVALLTSVGSRQLSPVVYRSGPPGWSVRWCPLSL